MRFHITIILAILFFKSAHALEIVDSIGKLSPRESHEMDCAAQLSDRFNSRQLILPGAFMAMGLAGSLDYDNHVNRSVNDAMTDLSNKHKIKADDYLRFLPSAGHLMLSFAGVKAKHTFKERLLISATAHATMLVLGYGLKYTIHESRPDLSDRHSFPSGHVAMAFTGAELMRQEYGNAWGIAGYTVATGVAFLRLYNNRHWLNDVLMGAGIGILSARIGHWLLPCTSKLFKINKLNNNNTITTALPYYDNMSHSVGVNILTIF